MYSNILRNTVVNARDPCFDLGMYSFTVHLSCGGWNLTSVSAFISLSNVLNTCTVWCNAEDLRWISPFYLESVCAAVTGVLELGKLKAHVLLFSCIKCIIKNRYSYRVFYNSGSYDYLIVEGVKTYRELLHNTAVVISRERFSIFLLLSAIMLIHFHTTVFSYNKINYKKITLEYNLPSPPK